MGIDFNVHGQQRKELIEQIANYTQQEAEYQYTPTYVYRIGKHAASKDGNLSSPNEIPSDLTDKLGEFSFRPANIVKLHLAYRRNGFTGQALKDLHHLVWAKGQLIRDVCQLDSLKLDVSNQRVTLSQLNRVKLDNTTVYQQFVDKLMQYVKDHQQAVSEPHREGDEKCAFHCFLLRPNFIGPECKTQRGVPLQSLIESAASKDQEA